MQWFIGLSSYYNFRWQEIFYPVDIPRKQWFDYYVTRFNSFELNSTFYAMPHLKTMQNWYDKAPDGFKFSAKVPKTVTHIKLFNDTRETMDEFYGVLRDGLREKLGCVLFQLPPRLVYSDQLLDSIIANTNPAFTNAIEFRNATWWNKKIQDQLAEHNIVFCGVSYPKLPDDVIINSSTNYYRLHGVPKLYYEQYDDAFIENLGKTISKGKKVKEAYVYFNNTASAAAIHNALHLKEVLNE
ncbi:MAG TPA: DUF72 domain-containing protein [Chitinophagales bacterium]|nr:DUF72 domain-containing protein [Chitinophagales bacterium]